MRLYSTSGRCVICDKPVDPAEHFHTITQVLGWLWDSQHRGYRVAIPLAGLIVMILLAAIISPITNLIRESL